MKLKIIVLILILVSTLQHIKADTLRVLHYENYYPYAFVNSEGLSDGMLIDYWKEWARANNIDVQYVSAPENEFISLINNNKADFIAGTFITDTFSTVFDFSEYIMRINTVLFLKSSLNIKTIHEVDFPLLTLEKQHTSQLLHQKFSELKTIPFKDFMAFIDEINTTQYNGFIYDYPSPINAISKFKTPSGYSEFYVLAKERIRPAVKKGNLELRNLLISGSNKISEEKIMAIAYKWNIISPKRNFLGLIIAFSMVLVLFVVFLIYTVKKQKKQALVIAGFESTHDWQVIIDKGENDLIEFKSSLRWDYNQEKPNKALEQVIVKTTSAFLNTKGGMLFIGVDDEGNILGLQKDYQTLSKKNRDGFMLAITNLININLGKNTHQFLSINIISINDKDICIVSSEKSGVPVFLGKGDKEEFYIRASASSQPLSIREAYEYIRGNWEN